MRENEKRWFEEVRGRVNKKNQRDMAKSGRTSLVRGREGRPKMES